MARTGLVAAAGGFLIASGFWNGTPSTVMAGLALACSAFFR